MSKEIDDIEMKQGMKGMAALAASFYLALLDEDFSRRDAMELTIAWLQATIQSANFDRGSDDDEEPEEP